MHKFRRTIATILLIAYLMPNEINFQPKLRLYAQYNEQVMTFLKDRYSKKIIFLRISKIQITTFSDQTHHLSRKIINNRKIIFIYSTH